MDLETPVRHLLVDLDGTILCNHQLPLTLQFARNALATLSKHGGVRKTLRALLDINREFKRTSREFTNDIRVVDLFAKRMGMTFEEARKVLREALAAVFPELKRHFYPMPGATEFLGWANNRYPMTLATNPVWPQEIVELRVQWAGIDPKIFSFITDARKMHACKPALEYYEEILAHQKLEPRDCLLIGNEIKMDLPATKVGIRTFIVGPFERASRLTALRDGKAPAWRGSFAALREMLETQAASDR